MPLELQDRVAKKGSGQVIPVHPDLHAAWSNWRGWPLAWTGRWFDPSAASRLGSLPHS